MVAGGLELAGAGGAFGLGLVAVALEHQLRRSPDVDLRYHAAESTRPRSTKGLRQCRLRLVEVSDRDSLCI